jgi:hypothetical protein
MQVNLKHDQSDSHESIGDGIDQKKRTESMRARVEDAQWPRCALA